MQFKENRAKVFALMEDKSSLVISSATMQQRSNDTFFPYRQESNFYYLTGFKEDDAYLVMTKRDKELKSSIFVHPKDSAKEMWEGKRLGVEKAKEALVMDASYSSRDFETLIKDLLKESAFLYHDFDKPISVVHTALQSLKHGRESHAYPDTFIDYTKILFGLRRHKQPWELDRIKKALAITKNAHHLAMAGASASKHEYEIQALIEYTFKSQGAYWDAYTTIVAGGNNANTLHYISNGDKLKEGSLVLIDAGSEFEMYASDITRTFPVNGKFSPVQRELYSEVLKIQKEVISQIKPKVLRSTLGDFAIRQLTQLMIDTKVLRVSLDEAIEKELYKPYYPHGIGHWMGLDVHDPLAYKTFDGREIAFEAGDVLTIEPALYLEASDKGIPKAYRGIGIRIEDNILVTKSGHQNLSIEIDKEIEDIEIRCQTSFYDYI